MTESDVRRPTFGDAFEDHRQEDEQQDDGLDGDDEAEGLPIVLTDGRRQFVDRLNRLGVAQHPLITLETVREGRLQDEAHGDGQTSHHDENDAQHPRAFPRSHQVTVHDAFEVAARRRFSRFLFSNSLFLISKRWHIDTQVLKWRESIRWAHRRWAASQVEVHVSEWDGGMSEKEFVATPVEYDYRVNNMYNNNNDNNIQNNNEKRKTTTTTTYLL